MATETTDCRINMELRADWTSADVQPDFETRNDDAPPRWRPLLSGSLAGVLSVLAGATCFINIPDPMSDIFQTISSPIQWEARERLGRAISLREARLRALQILARTEDGLRRDRVAEARRLDAGVD